MYNLHTKINNHIASVLRQGGGRWLSGLAVPFSCLLVACAAAPTAFPLSAERRSAQQQVELSVRGQTFRFSAVAQSSANRLSLIALGPMNARLFTLRYDGVALTLDKSLGAPKTLDERRVLSDFQLIFLPLSELQSLSELTLSEPMPGQRVVLRNGQPYAQIQYAAGAPWNGRSTLTNRSPGYRLTVDSIEILE